MALYAFTVSASVVQVQKCPVMQDKVVISFMDHSNCCCMKESATTQSGQRKHADLPTVHFTPDGLSSLAMTATSCCSQITLQSRLTSFQNTVNEVNILIEKAFYLRPTRIFVDLDFQALPANLQQPVLQPRKKGPPVIPLYKLFRRYTYYG